MRIPFVFVSVAVVLVAVLMMYFLPSLYFGLSSLGVAIFRIYFAVLAWCFLRVLTLKEWVILLLTLAFITLAWWVVSAWTGVTLYGLFWWCVKPPKRPP